MTFSSDSSRSSKLASFSMMAPLMMVYMCRKDSKSSKSSHCCTQGTSQLSWAQIGLPVHHLPQALPLHGPPETLPEACQTMLRPAIILAYSEAGIRPRIWF